MQTLLVHRCQNYTPDKDFGCYYATSAMINELKKDISENSLEDLQHISVVFKPELIQFIENPETEKILDFWIQQIDNVSLTKQPNFSLFDRTAIILRSEEKALQAFAVLLQDTTPGRKSMFNWLRAQPIAPQIDVIEKWMTVLDMIQSLPVESKRIFFPSTVWISGASLLKSAFYHFYVPTYLHAKIRQQKYVTPAYAATAVFLFNYLYENVQENGIPRAALFEPRKMKAERNLNDIRLAYLGTVWYEHRGNLPALYAQTAFLNLNQDRLKDSLDLWIERLIVMP